MNGEEEKPWEPALEAYRRARLHRSDELDEAFEQHRKNSEAAGDPARTQVASEQLSIADGAGPPEPPSQAPPGHMNGGGDGDDLHRFAAYADAARALIPEGKVTWRGSPFGWMLHNGPRTKSKLGRDIVREWLRDTGRGWQQADDGVAHFKIGGQAVIVHLSTLGKEGKLEFANLREPGLGADLLLLVGVEPQRARIWAVRPEAVRELHSYANDAPGYHNCSVDPDDPPDWMIERARWTS